MAQWMTRAMAEYMAEMLQAGAPLADAVVSEINEWIGSGRGEPGAANDGPPPMTGGSR